MVIHNEVVKAMGVQRECRGRQHGHEGKGLRGRVFRVSVEAMVSVWR